MTQTAEVVVCGAGITGVAAAFFLSKAGFKNLRLIDERPPLSFTSDRSTECYRNWWPDTEMLALMNRSIDLLEQLAEKSGNVFRMNRRGYLYLTADERTATSMEAASQRISDQGAGPLRVHSSSSLYYQPSPKDGFDPQLTGADLLVGKELLQEYFPYLTKHAVAGLHVRRAGWLSAQQLGIHLLEAARQSGVQFESGRVTGLETTNGCVSGIRLSSGERIEAPIFINAAGPYLQEVGRFAGVDLPVHNELHLKAAIKDSLGILGRDAPLLIWTDPQYLPWQEDERRALVEDEETRWLTDVFPSGVHTRPEGGDENQTILMLWEYQTRVMEPVWPPKMDEQYPEIALRGLTVMLPRMSDYFDRMPRPQLDGGYYTKTRENRPLIGPMGLSGAYMIGAVSGYGIMSACAAGELLAAHVTGEKLPTYASSFALSRYDDPAYVKQLEHWSTNGQL